MTRFTTELKLAVAVVACALLVDAAFAGAAYFAFGDFGCGPSSFAYYRYRIVWFTGTLLITGLAVLGSAAHALGAALGRSSWPTAGAYCAMSVTLAACFVVAIAGANHLEDWQLSRFGARHDPVVGAIAEFERTRGRPPESLDQLAPAYVSTIGRPAICIAAGYEYFPPGERGPSWQLTIPLGRDFIDPVFLAYTPDDDFGDTRISRRYERWALVRE